ncbi:MAG: HD domain-containing protein [Nanoarchaeota archaeon]|nr:HD domain-containing protein [Nanoarchaeota archaeon]
MIDKIKAMILELCEDANWDWKNHINSVVKYTEILAKQLNADEEVCELSAWLHDIIKIREGKRELHHVKGAEEAGKILEEMGYSVDKIEKVKHCILTHSSDKNYMPETKEAKILASADALAHFDNFLSLAYFAFVPMKLSIEETRENLLGKTENSWNKLIPEAKVLAKEKYEAIKLILSED